MEQFLQDHVYSMVHWPWLAVCVIMMVTMQVMKTSVFTKKRAYTKGKMQWLRWWGWKTLPLQPIVVGAIIGNYWLEPESGIKGVASIVYFMSSGACSVWLYQVLKGLAKKKNIDLTLPGQTPSIVPEKPEEEVKKDEKSN